MKSLQQFWFASAPIDLEHKQYVLMDFLQSVKDDFTLDVLYPWLSEVQKQYADLTKFKFERDEMLERFKKIKRINLEKMKLEYEYDTSWITKDFEEVHNIIEFSIPHLETWMKKGQHFYDNISNQMKWETIGLIPEYKDEGYFILHIDSRDIFIYRFKIENIILESDNYFGITTELIDFFNSRFKTYEDLKRDLIKKHKDLPVPYTVSVQTKFYPMKETLMPIVKRNGLVWVKNGY